MPEKITTALRLRASGSGGRRAPVIAGPHGAAIAEAGLGPNENLQQTWIVVGHPQVGVAAQEQAAGHRVEVVRLLLQGEELIAAGRVGACRR